MSFDDVTVIVLAGGYSRRFDNQIKALILYDSSTLLDHLLRKIDGVFDKIVISVASEEVRKKLGEINYPVLVDKHPIPLHSLIEICGNLTTRYALIIPIDMPLLTLDHLSTMLENISQYDLVSNLIEKNWVTSSCFAINIGNWDWQSVKTDLNQRQRLTDFIRYPKNIGLIALSDPKILVNVNTKEDLEEISMVQTHSESKFLHINPKIYLKSQDTRISNYRTEIDIWKGISMHILSHIRYDVENDNLLNSDEKKELFKYIEL